MSEFEQPVDFRDHTQTVFREYQLIRASEDNPTHRKIRMASLISGANEFLKTYDVFGAMAIMGTEASVDPDTIETLVGQGVTLETGGQPHFGIYEGFCIMETEADDDEDAGDADAIYHQLWIGTQKIRTPYRRGDIKLYALLPIASQDIEVLQAPLTNQAEESWLRTVCKDLLTTGVQITMGDLDDMHRRISAANASKLALAKNVNWLLDRLNYYLPYKDKDVKLTASDIMIATDEGLYPLIDSDSYRVGGSVLGFGEIDDYYIEEPPTGPKQWVGIPDQKVLVMHLDASVNGQQRIAQVPVRSIEKLEFNN